MIHSQEIGKLVELLGARQTSLYHACQFTDFQTYLRLGGIPSRAYLEQNQAIFTRFETDDIDHDNNVWDKVFVNLADFGEIFARGRQGVPNPFGPIVLQIKPSALLEAENIAVCLRSAGAVGFDRKHEALGCAADVDNLFLYDAAAGFPQSTFVKYGEQLREVFPQAANPEISCSFEMGHIPIDDVIVAWIDPYTIAGRPLIAWIQEEMLEAGTDFKVWERACCEERQDLYGEVLSVVYPATMTLHDVANCAYTSECMRVWADELQSRDLDYQFRRYANYLREGTIEPLLARKPKMTVKREGEFE